MEIISDPKVDLVDRVSILIKTEDENNFLFLQEDNNECNLPWKNVIDGDWKFTALKILSVCNVPCSLHKKYIFQEFFLNYSFLIWKDPYQQLSYTNSGHRINQTHTYITQSTN